MKVLVSLGVYVFVVLMTAVALEVNAHAASEGFGEDDAPPRTERVRRSREASRSARAPTTADDTARDAPRRRAECGPGETYCNGACRDLETDDQNCGACGRACPQGYSCVGGPAHCVEVAD